MGNGANTLTQIQRLPYDEAAWIATDIVNPGIALVESQGFISVLLARNVFEESDKATLFAVRWIQIPQGFRLWWLHYKSMIRPSHLTDEWLFNEVSIRYAKCDAFVMPSGPILDRRSKGAIPLRNLTHDQFDHLAFASGRSLYAQLIAMFPNELRYATRPHIPRLIDLLHWIGLKIFSTR